MRPLEYGPIGSKLEGADRALENSGPRICRSKHKSWIFGVASGNKTYWP